MPLPLAPLKCRKLELQIPNSNRKSLTLIVGVNEDPPLDQFSPADSLADSPHKFEVNRTPTPTPTPTPNPRRFTRKFLTQVRGQPSIVSLTLPLPLPLILFLTLTLAITLTLTRNP